MGLPARLQFHPSLAGCAELENRLPVGVGDEEVTEDNDIHANEHVDVLKIALHDLDAGHEVARGNEQVDEIDVGTGVPAYARDAALFVGLEIQLADDARRNNSGVGTVSQMARSVWKLRPSAE